MLDCQQAQASTGRSPPGQEKMSLSGLWQTLVRTHRVPDGTDIPPLISSIRDRLHDPEKEVRQHALRVLADLILALPKNCLKQHIGPLVPSMMMNLGHSSPAVKKSVIDCLKVYIRHSPTPNDAFSEIIKSDEDISPNILTGILTAIPYIVRPEILSTKSLERAIDYLWCYSQQCVNEEVCMKSLAKVRWKTGSDTFYKLLGVERLKPFENSCGKYGLLETHDEEFSSSSPEDRVILETEIQLDAGPSIRLQIHEESSDRDVDSSDQGIVRILEDDSDLEFYESARDTPKTPRRVHFGGEIVKMRTPESDSTQTSDSEKKVKQTTSAPVQSFLRDNVTNKRTKVNLIASRKAPSVDNLTSFTEGKSNKNSKIPISLHSVPNSPAKNTTPRVFKRKLHNSAPNLTRSSKIPKKVISEKSEITTTKTYSALNNQANENVDQKNNTSTKTITETNLIQDGNTFKIKENLKMIELNIKNNIALQIMFSNGNSKNESEKDDNGPSNETEQSREEELRQEEIKGESSKKEQFEGYKIEVAGPSRTYEKRSRTPNFSEASSLSEIALDSSESTDLKKDDQKVGQHKDELKNMSEESSAQQSTPRGPGSANKSIENKKKDKQSLNIAVSKSRENDSPDTSPLIDEKLLLQSMTQPRRYSRAEDILSPTPIHNEIEILHNLARSPEHSKKNKSRPTTATVRSKEEKTEDTSTQKTYESFRIFSDDMSNSNPVSSNKNEEDQQKAEMNKDEKKNEEYKMPTSDSKLRENVRINENPQETSLHGTSCFMGVPAGRVHLSLPDIIENLQEIDLTKKSSAFDSLMNSLQDVDFIKSFSPNDTKALLQLLFLYETQARFRKGSRDALYTILEHIQGNVMRECFPQIAKGIGRMGAPYGVRLAISVMKKGHLAGEFLNYLPYESSRGREGSLQILMAACRLFPSTEIDINTAIRKSILALGDKRRRIRHASLETLASLAQVAGNSAIFEVAREMLQVDKYDEALLKAIRARLSRRQLPMVDFDGNIRYTVPREQAEIDWIYPGGTANHSAPSLLHSLQRNDLRQRDDLVPLKNANAAIIPLDLQNQKKLMQRKGVLRPVYCILPSPEESDEGPSVYYPDKYGRGRSILPPTQKIRCGSQDRIRWREKGPAKRFPAKYDIKKSFSSDQLYHSQPVSLDARVNMTSTSSISSGSDYSSSNGSQSRSFRWQESGIPILRPRGYWGTHSDKSRAPHDSPSSLRTIQRQSSGSESSGYFTPPPAEKQSAGMSPIERPNERPASVNKVATPLKSPHISSAMSEKSSEEQGSQDETQEEKEGVEYIEVINSEPSDSLGEKIDNELTQTKIEDIQMQPDHNKNYEDHSTNENGIDEVDRKVSCPSISDFDFNITKPIAENRKWSKSEINLEKSLPIIVDRKNVNSAPLIKDIFNNNISNDIEETTFSGPTHICNNTNINITIPLPGTLIQEEEVPSEPVLVRRLSKRYSQVPVFKKPTSKPSKAEPSARTSSRPKTNLVNDVLEQMASQEWETVMSGLRNLGKLAKTNCDVIEPQMHSVCTALANNIKNLRSQVARAACQASKEIFVTGSQKGLEAELEEIVGPLLHRTADTNKFLREDANNALNSMIEKIHPAKVIIVLTTKGTTHQNAIVRGTTTRLLEQLIRTHGTEKIFSLGKDIRDRVILAGANSLTEGSLETRNHAKALLRHMISHPNFQKALVEAVPPHTIRHIAKTLNSLKSSQ